MLLYQSKIIGLPIASLQASHRIGIVRDFVVKPQNLTIVALVVESPISDEDLYLHCEDIVTIKPRGLIINHNQQLMEADDLVRLSELIEKDFQVLGKQVVTNHKAKIGRVSDYAVNINTWLVQKIVVQPPIVKILGKSDRLIDRSQIIKVNDKQIVVREATEPGMSVKKAVTATLGLQGNQLKPEVNSTDTN